MTGAIFGTRIIAAPMAGGTTTPRFVQAVDRAGGLGFLAAGYKTVESMQTDMREVRSAGARFGMNLFVPDRSQLNPPPLVRQELEGYRRSLEADARQYGVALPGLRLDDDDEWQGKIDALLADPVEFVSFTFGLPGQAEVSALKRAGSTVVATVTGTAEATLAAERGADVLVVQHGSAGGHSATFLPSGRTSDSPGPATTAELLAAVGAVVDLPLVAAGGIMDSTGVAAVLAAGGTAAQLGTAFLRSDESGARRLHKDALADQGFTETRMTRAFTGRQARALVNSFVRGHADAPEGYPAIHHLTAPIRAAAAAAGDPEKLNLWAGTGWRQAAAGPVAAIMDGLLAEAAPS